MDDGSLLLSLLSLHFELKAMVRPKFKDEHVFGQSFALLSLRTLCE